VDGEDGHLSLLDIRRVFFKVCPRAQSSGFRGSRLMELSPFSLFSRLPPHISPFYLLRGPMQSGTVRARGCCILLCAERVEETWMHGFFFAIQTR
jgi:hypothetical protein